MQTKSKLHETDLIAIIFLLCMMIAALGFISGYLFGKADCAEDVERQHKKETQSKAQLKAERIETFCSLLVQTGLIGSCTVLSQSQQAANTGKGKQDGRLAVDETGGHRRSFEF